MYKVIVFTLLIILLSGCSGKVLIPQDPELKMLTELNIEINKVRYVTDYDNYGVEEYYATIEEFYKRGGDCEEYSLAKYARLREMGYSPKQLWLLVGNNSVGGHNVLLVKTNKGDYYILDMNYNSLKKPSKSGIKPYYRYNEEQIQAYVDRKFNNNIVKGYFSKDDENKLFNVFKKLK